jgi:hypothetical protein
VPNNAYYRTKDWAALCAIVKRRSGGMCEVPGCNRPGKIVDHVRTRTDGGPDTPDNLRHLCRYHDNQVKEDARGKRRSDGKLTVPGCTESGQPVDPGHWWNKGTT